MNLCSIYSNMNKHDVALRYAEQAVSLLSAEYEACYVHGHTVSKDHHNFITVVATAYHTASVEYEHAGDFSNSLIMG